MATIDKFCNFDYEITSTPVKLTIEVGNGFAHSAWTVRVNGDIPLTNSRPQDLIVKRTRTEDTLCDESIQTSFVVDRTNSLAHGTAVKLILNGHEFLCNHKFSDQEKQEDTLTVQYGIDVNLKCK